MSVIGRFRLIMMSGQSKPSPQVGQVLGPLGINMMNFCKEFNARTTQLRSDVPMQVTLVPSTDKTYRFVIRSPQAQWFIRRVSRVHTLSPDGSRTIVGNITLKELYHIAEAKAMDPQFIGASLRSICMSLLGTCRAMGILVTKERLIEYKDRDDVHVTDLVKLRKEARAFNKLGKKAKK